MLGPILLVGSIFFLFRTWGENWMDYPDDSLIFKWRELWRFFTTDLATVIAYVVYLVSWAVSIKLWERRLRILEEEWDIYLDELSRKYPSE